MKNLNSDEIKTIMFKNNIKYNDEKIRKNFETTELFSEKILIMQDKLKKQKELLERMRSSLV